jgi:hypothetical protein
MRVGMLRLFFTVLSFQKSRMTVSGLTVVSYVLLRGPPLASIKRTVGTKTRAQVQARSRLPGACWASTRRPGQSSGRTGGVGQSGATRDSRSGHRALARAALACTRIVDARELTR